MAITLADIELLCSTPEVEAWVAQNISLRDLLADSWRIYFPTAFGTNFVWPGWAERKVEIGKLWWPAGASRPGIGHFLADQGILDQLQPAMSPTAGGLTAATLKLTEVDPTDDSETGSVEATVYLLPPRPLSGYPANDDTDPGTEQLFLLTVVDRRFFLFMQNTGALTATTYSTLLGQIATNTSLTLTVETVDADYSTPPTTLNVSYENAAVWLDGVAYAAGQRIVFGLTGSATSQLPASAATAAAANLALSDNPLAGGAYSADFINNNMPAQVKVIFPNAVPGQPPTQKTATVNSLGHSFAPTFHHPFQDTGNSTALQSLADQLGSDLNTWLKPVCDVVFAGIVNATPNGLQDIEWTYRYRRDSMRLPEDMIGPDPTYPQPPAVGELDDEADWYESEVTTRITQAPFLDFTALPATAPQPTYIPGMDGEPGEYFPIPGPPGRDGSSGSSSSLSSAVPIPGMDGEPGEDGTPVYLPNKDIGCKLTGGNASVSAAATTALAFPTETYDTNGMHDTGANTERITIHTPGKYWIWGRARGTVTTPSAGSYGALILYKNGAATQFRDAGSFITQDGSGDAPYVHLQVCEEDICIDGDYYELFWKNGDSATVTVANGNFGARRVDGAAPNV